MNQAVRHRAIGRSEPFLAGNNIVIKPFNSSQAIGQKRIAIELCEGIRTGGMGLRQQDLLKDEV